VGAVAAAIFLAEGLIKAYFRTSLAFQSIPVIPNIFHLTVVFNKGAAFGIFAGRTTFLIYVTIVFIFVFALFVKHEKKRNMFFLAACGMILGGAISNLADRVFLGYVVDYLDFRVWPVFNLADSCITVGSGILIFDSFRCQIKGEHGKDSGS